MSQNWNKYYERYGPMTPQEDMPRVLRLFKERGVRKVLDLGCGSGRHLVYLTEQDFEVFGIDIAARAIAIIGACQSNEAILNAYVAKKTSSPLMSVALIKESLNTMPAIATRAIAAIFFCLWHKPF